MKYKFNVLIYGSIINQIVFDGITITKDVPPILIFDTVDEWAEDQEELINKEYKEKFPYLTVEVVDSWLEE